MGHGLNSPPTLKTCLLFLGMAWLGYLFALEDIGHAEEKGLSASVSGGPGRTFAGKEMEKGAGDPAAVIRKLLGAEVRTATQQDLKPYGPCIRGGVVIVLSQREGPLGGAGFEPDDLIVEVEGLPIGGLRELADQIVRVRGKQSILMLGLDHRTGRAGYVQVVVP